MLILSISAGRKLCQTNKVREDISEKFARFISFVVCQVLCSEPSVWLLCQLQPSWYSVCKTFDYFVLKAPLIVVAFFEGEQRICVGIFNEELVEV